MQIVAQILKPGPLFRRPPGLLRWQTFGLRLNRMLDLRFGAATLIRKQKDLTESNKV